MLYDDRPNGHRIVRIPILFALVVLLMVVFAQSSLAQGPLNYYKNYFLTGGDYVVGGWQKNQPETVTNVNVLVNGVSTSVPYVTGVLAIPDTLQAQYTGVTSPGVPNNGYIVAAFLYWQTVESNTQSPSYGQTAFFQATTPANANSSGQAINGPQYTVTGTDLTSSSPVGWSSGGCTGSSGGSKIVSTYRADVLRYLNLDPDSGQILGNSTYTIMMPDSGSNGNTAPFTLGATLVLVYRDTTSPSLNAVVIYDGSYAASNQALTTTQQIQGFYQPTLSTQPFPVAKFTQIVGSGQANKSEFVSFSTSTGSTVNLPSLYPTNNPTLPPFPGVYNGFWDNPTWYPNTYGNAVVGSQDAVTTATTVVTPNPANPDCPSWGAMVFKTNVQDTDGDGLLDIWESQNGLTDPNGNALPNLAAMGANPNVPDVFVEADYMCSAFDVNNNCSTAPGQHSHKPAQTVMDQVGQAFSNQGINIHFDIGPNYQGACSTTTPSKCPDPYIIQGGANIPLQGGQQILETACNPLTNPTTCIFPNFPGTVGWKLDYLRYKNGDSTNPSDLPPANPPLPGFNDIRKDTFHYALLAHTIGFPRWLIPDGTLVSVAVSGGTATVTTGLAHGLSGGNFVSVSGAPATANINGVYTVASVINSTSFTISVPASAPAATYANVGLGVGNGIPRSTSGVADILGGDLMVTLGRWDGGTGSPFMQASTLMHELGHNLGLGHAGSLTDTNNCKPNYQSVMNYEYQVGGLLDKNGVPHVDYSSVLLQPLGEDTLSEPTGLGSSPLPLYVPRWYAPANSTLAQKLGIAPATLHCNGTPITANEPNPTPPGMVRVDGDATTLSTGFVDWDYDGEASGDSDPATITQDVNFDGKITSGIDPTKAFQGFNDWSNLKLNQVGARWNFVYSLDVLLNQTQDLSDWSITTTPTWTQVVSDWSDPGILGASFGGLSAGLGNGLSGGLGGLSAGLGNGLSGGLGGLSAGLGGLSAGLGGLSGGLGGGELDADIASGNGNSPSSLVATPAKFTINLSWSAPSLGTANNYTVWRGTCTVTPCTITNSSAIPYATVSGTMTTFVDNNTKKGVPYLYFVEANITYPNGRTAESGPSNTVIASR